MQPADVAKRLGVLVVVALVVVAIAAAVPLTTGGETATDSLSNPEYESDDIVDEPIPANGTVSPDVDGTDRSGLVLIDTAHANGLSRADIAPLVTALTVSGLDVEFLDSSDDVSEELERAKALVVIDPVLSYSDSELEAVERFTDRGGHLLLVGEPDRIRVGGAFGLSLTTRTSQFTELASTQGVAFETRYLYNLETNDGNYKHVIARAASGSDLEGVERTTHYTATRVSATGGRPLLVTTEGTHLSDGGPEGRYTVATRTDSTIAVGDSTFLQSDRHTIADNEVFLEYVVEFLAAGEGGSE